MDIGLIEDEPEGSGISTVSPKFWLVLSILLLLPLGFSAALYGAREARLIRAANILASHVQSPQKSERGAWEEEDWVDYLVKSVPSEFRKLAEADTDSRRSPFDGIRIERSLIPGTWQLVVSADGAEHTIFIDIFSPDSKQPFYTREARYDPETHPVNSY